MGRGGQARASSGLVAAVLGSGNDTRIAIGVGLSQAGAPDFELNLGGPKGVREALAQTDSSLKAALLQALRWRVLRRSGAGQGKAVVDYVDADVLDAHAGCGLVHSLLSSPHARVQQQAARFLECLSRQAQGRAYLMSGNGRLLEQVTTAIKGIQGDTRTRRALLRCLQQCSRRSPVQDVAVAAGVVEWIVAQLYGEADSMSEESAEYMTALLVNLAQRSAGRHACVSLSSRLLPLLVDLLEHDSMRLPSPAPVASSCLLPAPKRAPCTHYAHWPLCGVMQRRCPLCVLCVQTYIRVYKRMSVCVCVFVPAPCERAFACVSARVHLCVCVCARARARMCVCARACVRACVRAGGQVSGVRSRRHVHAAQAARVHDAGAGAHAATARWQ